MCARDAYDRYGNVCEFNVNKAVSYLLNTEVMEIIKSKLTFPEGGNVSCFAVCVNDSIAVCASIYMTVGYDDIRLLYHLVKKDPEYGHHIWALLKEKHMPSWKYMDILKRRGIWDIDQLQRVFKLEPNPYD